MIVSGFIIIHDSFLNTFSSHIDCNMDLVIHAPFRSKDSKLYRIQCTSRITACHICQKIECLLIDHCAVASHTFFDIIYRTLQKLFNIFLTQRFQFKDTGSGNQRTVHLKIRILSRCSDQYDRTVLHKRKQIILLPFVKAVNLIYEKDRLLLIHSFQILRFLYYILHILFTCNRGIDLPKFRAGRMCDHFSKRRLTSSRRSIEDNGAQLVRLNSPI